MSNFQKHKSNFTSGPYVSCAYALLLMTAMVPAAAQAQTSVSLTPSVSGSAPVGTMVTWTATVNNAVGADAYRYRFLIHAMDRARRVLKDFSPSNTLDWMPSEEEGQYTVEVTARNLNTGAIAASTVTYVITPALDNGGPHVSATVHPLVYLYSAPACPTGAAMHIVFSPSAGGTAVQAPAKACDGVHSMNFYIAGLRQSTAYNVKHVLKNADSTTSTGPVLTFTSGTAPDGLPVHAKLYGDTSTLSQPVLLASSLFDNYFVASDLDGNLIWYYPQPGYTLTRAEPGGRFLSFYQDPNGDTSKQSLREFDLAGGTLSETTAEQVNAQLVALGKSPINAFHHEVRRLSNGDIAVLGGVESLETNVQGPGTVDVLGDMIIVLNENLKVVWTWDTFDHLDVTRTASLGDQCVQLACPPLLLSDTETANDWTHGNAIAETADGNLTYSTRSQDLVIKIDYAGGKGSGDILWKLGRGGDFALNSADASVWFSHQHDPHFLPDGTLILLDNGNVRQSTDPSAHSRGQVYQLDQTNMVATPLLSVDLGDYSYALGAAEKLTNGNYFFDDGFLENSSATSTEFDPTGTPVYAIRSSTPEYRTFRMVSLYTPQSL